MAQNIRLKRSAVAAKVPLTTDLALGELAINTYDGKMFFKKDVSGTQSIIQLANNNEVVKLTGDQTIAGAITFSSPVAPHRFYSGLVVYPENTTFGVNMLSGLQTGQIWLGTTGSEYSLFSNGGGFTTGKFSQMGTPSSNTDLVPLGYLNTQLATKANDADVVKLTGNQTIAGTKTFSSDAFINGHRIGRGLGNVSNNIAIGTNFNASTTGQKNTAIGPDALGSTTSGESNTALGFRSSLSMVTGSYNVSLGENSLAGCQSGAGNMAIGFKTLESCTTGGSNTAIGGLSLQNLTTGGENVGIGANSLYGVTSSWFNIGIGANTLFSNAGWNNVAVGWGAARYHANGTTPLTGAMGSVYIGASCRGFNNSDSNSVVIAGVTNTAQGVSDGANTTVIGNAETVSTKLFGRIKQSMIGTDNFVIGNDITGSNLTASKSNIFALGSNNLRGTGVGNNSTAVGNYCMQWAGDATSPGTYNTAVGFNALVFVTTGERNTAVGGEALYNTSTGSNNFGLGFNALFANTTGSQNIAIGSQCLGANTSATDNIAFGSLALGGVTGANQSRNIAAGTQAGWKQADGTSNVTACSNSIFIGPFTRANGNSQTNQIVIGDAAIGDGSNTTVIGNTSTISTRLEGSLRRNAPVTKTANFTLGDKENWVINNKSGSSCTVTLPAASSWTGREVTFKNIQAQTLISASSNVVPIDTATAGTAILPATAGAWATLVSNGTNWIIMMKG